MIIAEILRLSAEFTAQLQDSGIDSNIFRGGPRPGAASWARRLKDLNPEVNLVFLEGAIN
jgi:hypothetical protein